MDSRLLSEQEGATLVGVTEQTIREYARFGFLNPIKEGEKILYKEIEIKRLFGDEAAEVQNPTEEQTTQVQITTEANQAAYNKTSEPSLTNTSTVDPVDSLASETTSAKTEFVHEAVPHESGYELVALNRRLREEIQQLREERDWLRGRLEKQDERVERDQMLLLTDMQTIRTLVNKPEKKGFWARALPWLND